MSLFFFILNNLIFALKVNGCVHLEILIAKMSPVDEQNKS